MLGAVCGVVNNGNFGVTSVAGLVVTRNKGVECSGTLAGALWQPHLKLPAAPHGQTQLKLLGEKGVIEVPVSSVEAITYCNTSRLIQKFSERLIGRPIRRELICRAV